jgi:phosphoribosyl 1,2-cyclic phosphodiesterase
MRVGFFGVRGSTPCPSPITMRYGGNTSCVGVDVDGADPIVFDLGTGLRLWGETLRELPMRAHALVTHLHWDHIQGLPFLVPIHDSQASFDIYGPTHDGVSVAESFGVFMNPPLFPIQSSELQGEVSFHDVHDESFDIGSATVTAAPVPHVGATNGYRVESEDGSVAYVSDHQEPVGRPEHVDAKVLELCRDVDILIHDAQYTSDEFEARSDWGHCTVPYAVEVAVQSGAKKLVLFHHDPSHCDDSVDGLLKMARTLGEPRGIEVIAAAEGMMLECG